MGGILRDNLGEGVIVGSLIFIHHRCWEVLPFLTIQRQWCIKILCPKDPEFYTPLALNRQKGQHLPALEVYKNQSPKLRVKNCRETVGGEKVKSIAFWGS